MPDTFLAPIPAALPQKRSVLGIHISATCYDEVVRVCEAWIYDRRLARSAGMPREPVSLSRYICVVSVHGVIMAREDRHLRRTLNEADIATPDGMPLVWALRSFGVRDQQRVYGPNLMLRLCAMAERQGVRVFLYGGRPESLPVLIKNLMRHFPGLCICDSYSPPFRPLTVDEDRQIRSRIRQSGAELLLVGISTPNQDRWMQEHRDIPGLIMVGVGAAFDFHAGRVQQAPEWMQHLGLEWLFRLLAEPRRLWRRYLLVTPRFLPLWAMQKLGILKYPECNVFPRTNS
jgi:N-acetylglucosaminyldiphosphoundecaprenol N-acetyl-beta-D-mannosaminyltransferase